MNHEEEPFIKKNGERVGWILTFVGIIPELVAFAVSYWVDSPMILMVVLLGTMFVDLAVCAVVCRLKSMKTYMKEHKEKSFEKAWAATTSNWMDEL